MASANVERRFARVRPWHVLAVALGLRLAWAALVPVVPVSDALAYDELALRLAGGHGYSWNTGQPTAYWPAGTAALYGLVYALFGHSMAAVAVVNALLGTLLVAATMALARICFRPATALLAGLLIAIWPTWIAFTTIISSELATNVLFTAGVACALWPRGNVILRTVAATTLLVGATYFRANMLPFVLLVPVAAVIGNRRPRELAPRVIAACLVGALLIAPWAMRNQRVLGAAVPTSTNFGVNLWIGNNPAATGGYIEAPAPEGTLPDHEIARDRFYRDRAAAFIIANPLRYLQLSLRRVAITLDRETFGAHWNERGLPGSATGPLKALMTGYWYAIFLAALGGLFLFVRRRGTNVFSPLVLLAAATLATPVLVMANERYHYALAPFVAIFAALLICERGRADAPATTEASA